MERCTKAKRDLSLASVVRDGCEIDGGGLSEIMKRRFVPPSPNSHFLALGPSEAWSNSWEQGLRPISIDIKADLHVRTNSSIMRTQLCRQ